MGGTIIGIFPLKITKWNLSAFIKTGIWLKEGLKKEITAK